MRYLRSYRARFTEYFSPMVVNETRAFTCFFAAYAYFLASHFMCNSGFIYALGVYGLVLPSLLYLLVTDPLIRQERVPHNTGVWLLLVFLGYVTLHAVLVHFPDQSIVQTLRNVGATLLFLTASFIFFSRPSVQPMKILQLLVPIALVCGLISIFWFSNIDRLIPIGRLHSSISGPNAYTIPALIAGYLLIQRTTDSRWKLCSVAMLVVIAALIIFSKSRGPLLATLISFGLLLLLSRRWKTLRYGLILGAAIMCDYVYYKIFGTSLLHDSSGIVLLNTRIFENRSSYRLVIWQDTLDYIRLQPWLGYGMQSQFYTPSVPTAVNPHNLFLGTAYYIGIPGFVLFMAPLGAAITAMVRRLDVPENKLYLVLMVHGVAATFTDTGQPIKSDLWLIYWLPIMLALAQVTRLSRLARMSPSATHMAG